jgi:inorganic pyrophosphatase
MTRSDSAFFENCKGLEQGKRVKIGRWRHADEVREEIRESVAAYNLQREASK